MSQNDEVLALLKKGWEVTDNDVYLHPMKCRRLAARIYDLRAKGYQIASIPKKYKSPHTGEMVRYAAYKLEHKSGVVMIPGPMDDGDWAYDNWKDRQLEKETGSATTLGPFLEIIFGENEMTDKTDLQRIQANLNVPKNQFNDFAKFSYRNCEDILKAVKPLLDELNCMLTLDDEIVHVKGRFYVRATACLIDSNGKGTSVQAFAREPEEKKGMDEMQLTGATSSYARKYALSGLFLLDDNKDSDSVLNVSEAEVDAFTDLIEAGEGAKLFLMQTNDHDKYMALLARATPKAGKVAFKENLRDLTSSVVATAQTAAGIMMEFVEKEDEHGLRETWDEYDRDEQAIIWRQFNPLKQDEVKAMLDMTKVKK